MMNENISVNENFKGAFPGRAANSVRGCFGEHENTPAKLAARDGHFTRRLTHTMKNIILTISLAALAIAHLAAAAAPNGETPTTI